MGSFRLVVLVVFCVCRIYVADAVLGKCTPDPTGCADNAICDTDGVTCVCPDGFVEGTDDGGTAACVEVLGSMCGTEEDCSTDLAHTDCVGTVCACATGYIKQDNICVAVGLGSCDTNSNTCKDNAICNEDDTACVCKDGFVENTAGGIATCVAVLGKACNPETDNQCSAQLKHTDCVASICACATDFTKQDNICVAVVLGKACISETECSTQLEHADCVDSVCACATDFTKQDNICAANDPGSGGPRSLPCVLLMASMAIFIFSFM